MPISTMVSETKKEVPSSLHCYELLYDDETTGTLFGNGAAHAYAISKEMWPHKEIIDVIQLDDSWKH